MMRADSYGSFNTHFPSIELPPLNLPQNHPRNGQPHSNRASLGTMDVDDDDEDNDAGDDGMFPAKLIKRENQRHSFFRTILNPEHETPVSPSNSAPRDSDSLRPAPTPGDLNDPITAKIINEEEARVIFDLVFLRLNPFVNLFDPALHSVAYVRSKCPLLFTTLIMAGAKFFRPEIYRECQKLANDLAVRAFAEQWKRVEVVQAFACLTYWKEPDDNRTWTYIGYAARMAIELGLNRYVSRPSPNETERQMRERRNRERTYLVLWVHDRSLSMQTGRHWMLPEDELVRNSVTWHEEGGNAIRPEDVILGAFVNLRRIAAETTEMFFSSTGLPGLAHSDVNYDVVLGNCNRKLTQWMDTWEFQMKRAHGEPFHYSLLSLFRLYVRLFLNSFGIQASIHPASRTSPSLQALTACFTSACDTLKIVSADFAKISMLRYGQDSITVMSAYAAVFLLKLLNSSNTLAGIPQGAAHEIHALIMKTAEAYFDASLNSPSTSAVYHARFLRNLVDSDVFKARESGQDRQERFPLDPRLQESQNASNHVQESPAQMYPQSMAPSFKFPASPHMPPLPDPPQNDFPENVQSRDGATPLNYQFPATANPSGAQTHELDAHYWRNIFLDLGFGGGVDQSAASQYAAHSNVRHTAYIDNNGMSNHHMPSYHHIPPAAHTSYVT
jgi:hypothetical protein